MSPSFSFALELPIAGRATRIELESASSAIAIVGPSGIGKTTLLRALAGLVPSARGRAIVGDVLQDDGRGVCLPPHRRRLGWVPQEARLFPHLTVAENLAFGGPAQAAIAEALGVGGLLARSPETLSGGERQRVAIARALASKPRALLLDEPLVALDRTSRADVARFVVEHCAEHGILRVVVAHDESDLAALATERFVMGAHGIVP